jgi:hypothetical protein
MSVFEPVMAGHVTHRRAIRLTAFLAIMVGMFLAQVATATANNGFSFTPSKTEPFAVCGNPKPGHAACFAIIVPTASSRRLAHPGVTTNVEPSYEGSGVGGGFDPADLQSAYNLPSSSSGSGQTVAIVDAYDDPNAESDLAKYRSRYGLSACATENGCFKKVNQSGGATYPSPNASWAVEISLDLDMVSAACPKCHILLVEATTNSYGNLLTAEDEAATLGATEIGNSWGSEEFSGETSDDEYFHHPGVDITVSAGDHGYEVEYPAASHYVIAVGGTALKKASNTRGWSETAWSGTGSGCSAYEPKPPWQHDTGCSHRTNNDVSAVASPETPVSVADSYELPAGFFEVAPGWTLVGGTSASSPFIAGTTALTNRFAKELGAEAFYLDPGSLNDVTEGSNGTCSPSYLCTAGVGYDGPTGLGTPSGIPSDALPAGSAPAVVRDSSTGDQWLYYVGSEGAIWGFAWNGSKWNSPEKIGGSAFSGSSPVVIREASTGDQWLYYQGSEGAIWGFAWNGSKWSKPEKIGGSAAPGTSPTVIRDSSTGDQWLYYQGSEGAIWGIAWTGSKWNSPEKIGGSAYAGSSPVVIRDSSTGDQWLYYEGSEGAIWGFAWNGSKWSKPEKIGGSAAPGTTPAVIRESSTGDQWLYYQASETAIWGFAWNGSSWSKPELIP